MSERPALSLIVYRIPKNEGWEVRVTLDEYLGNPTIDIRLFGQYPTQKGVTFAIRRLPELARALADAEALAREMGLLP